MDKINPKKIQLSQTRIVKDAITVWNQAGPDVDIVMDLKNLSFREGSIDAIYSFHVLDHLFPEEVLTALINWRRCLINGGKLFTIIDDFEYIARAFIGGDISIDLVNDIYNHPMQFSRDSIVFTLRKAGFKDDLINIWLMDVPDLFPKQHYELIMESIKHE